MKIKSNIDNATDFNEIVSKKYGTLNIVHSDLYIISDFDNTITTGESYGSLNVITKSNLLGEDYQKEYIDIVNKYENRAKYIEKDSKLIEKLWEKHISKYLKMLEKYNLNRELLESIIENSNITFRKGFKEFIGFLHDKKIPLIILSSGLGNSIEIFLNNNNCYYDNIYVVSNFIEFNKEGYISKVPETVITPVNKNKVIFDDKLKEILKVRKYKVIFGDIKDDSGMTQINKEDKSLSVAFLNDLDLENELELAFDIVDKNNNVLDWIENILQG